MRVAYQGAPGAYGETAAFAVGDTPVAHREFPDVLAALRSGDVERAVLPVANSTIGPIEPVVQLLADAAREPVEVSLVGEVVIPVHHCLIRPAGGPEMPWTQVLSHPAALAQCRRFLARHPEAVAREVFDTAGALDEVAGQPGVVVIASERAAQLRGATVLERHLEDEVGNETRFVVLARSPSQGAR